MKTIKEMIEFFEKENKETITLAEKWGSMSDPAVIAEIGTRANVIFIMKKWSKQR